LEHLILTYEEVLLEVLCFDFDVRYPHTYLADIIATYDTHTPDPVAQRLTDCAWSVAHDSYRTPLCILLPPQVIAAAAFLFAQCLAEGPNGPSLTERLEVANPADTPWCQILGISGNDLQQVAGMYFTLQLLRLLSALAVGLVIMCQFYGSTVRRDKGKPDITPYKLIMPPSVDLEIPILFSPPEAQTAAVNGTNNNLSEGSKTPKTPATQKSIPSTPFQSLALESPMRVDTTAATPGQT
jgi:cyclin K